jgi:hypothetical protein
VTIASTPTGKPIPPGFQGFSIEYNAILRYTGTHPRAINPVLVRLIRELNPGQSPQLRIGGNSTDRSWWPVPGMAQPRGVRYSLSNNWGRVVHSLATELHAHLILGVDMEAKSLRLARYEARRLEAQVGKTHITAFELGNEPELYGAFPYYQLHGKRLRGRPRNYSPPDFSKEYARVAGALPTVPLAGPATGQPVWRQYLPQFVAAQRRLRLITLHLYATRGCFTSPYSPQYHSIMNLLSIRATRGLAGTAAPYLRLGHIRVDELGSVNCGGTHGISDTFASALWSLDTLFQFAKVGVAGVNFHTFPGARYQPFAFTERKGRWLAQVKPDYYGMLMFAQAAPAGSRLLAGSGQVGPQLDVWATRAPSGQVQAVAVNYGTQASTIALHLPGDHGEAAVERLAAPSVAAFSGVTIGGRSFTAGGTLTGAPKPPAIKPTDGAYRLSVPADSAALITPT